MAHFAFRWVNCLLTRELPLQSLIRLWDTCLSEDSGFEVGPSALLRFIAPASRYLCVHGGSQPYYRLIYDVMAPGFLCLYLRRVSAPLWRAPKGDAFPSESMIE